MVAFLVVGGCATLATDGDPKTLPPAAVGGSVPAAPRIVVASSGGLADARAHIEARADAPAPTPTASGWFATAVAEQADPASAEEWAARVVGPSASGAPSPPGPLSRVPAPPAAPPAGEGEVSARGKPLALPTRRPAAANGSAVDRGSGQAAAGERGSAPAAAVERESATTAGRAASTPVGQAPGRGAPPPLDLAHIRATAQAAIRGAGASATPGPLDAAERQLTAQERSQELAARSPGYDTVMTRVAVAAAARPSATPAAYRTRVPAWTPGAGGPTPTLGPTRTPRPRTPTPAAQATRSPFVPPQIRNGDNKWGVGIYRTSNEVLDTVRLTQPGVILLMDTDEAWARKVREAAPNAFIVGRRYRREDDQPLDNPAARGEDFADWVAELAVPLKGTVDAWMSYNEVVAHNAYDDYKQYDQFQTAFARRLQDTYGVAAVANNDGSGAVEPEDYPKYFAESIRVSQYFGLHAYSPPKTDRMTVDAEWNALRYRKIHAELEKAGIRGKQMVITESGLGDGYRQGVASDDTMAQDFVWFTRELQKDPYVIGHAAFGLFNGTGAWDRFELSGTLVPRLVRQMLSSR